MDAGWAVLGTHAAQLYDRTARIGEIGDPNIIVAVNGNSPRAGKAAAREWRARIICAIGPQHGNAAAGPPAFLLRHRFREVVRGRCNALRLQAYSRVHKMCHTDQTVTEAVGDPNVPLAIDAKPTTAESDSRFECLRLVRIRGREA